MAAASEFSQPRQVTPGDDWISIVRKQVEGLGYGTVQIVVHDHHVVQIDKTERFRLPGNGGAGDRNGQRG